jgi:hypothetical protein
MPLDAEYEANLGSDIADPKQVADASEFAGAALATLKTCHPCSRSKLSPMYPVWTDRPTPPPGHPKDTAMGGRVGAWAGDAD